MSVLDYVDALESYYLICPDVKRILDRGVSTCVKDNLPLSTHPRCKGCTVLIGPEHDESILINGLCSDCHKWKDIPTNESD